MMTNQELILGVMRAQGKADALESQAKYEDCCAICHQLL